MAKTVSPNVVVFLGAGGVGKTTLSTSFALAAAQSGQTVVLLSIDPARRLQSALSVGKLDDEITVVPLVKEFKGKLYAGQLNVEQAFSRWIKDEGMPHEAQEKLHGHVFFQTLVSRVATMGDAFAAVRVAEILEKMPNVDCIVVDTPPGIHAIDFLTKPERMREFLNSRTMEFIKMFGRGGGLFSRALKAGAAHLLDALGNIAGHGFITAFGELLVLSEGVFNTMSNRLEAASKILRSSKSSYVFISAVRDDAINVVEDLNDALKKQGIVVSFGVLNRIISSELQNDKGFSDFLEKHQESSGELQVFVNYVRSWISKQDVALKRMKLLVPSVVQIPLVPGLESSADQRLQDLAELGALILEGVKNHKRGSL